MASETERASDLPDCKSLIDRNNSAPVRVRRPSLRQSMSGGRTSGLLSEEQEQRGGEIDKG